MPVSAQDGLASKGLVISSALKETSLLAGGKAAVEDARSVGGVTETFMPNSTDAFAAGDGEKSEIQFPSHGSWNLSSEKGETSEGTIRIINLRFDYPVNGYRSVKLIIDVTERADNKLSKAFLLSLKEAEKQHDIQRGAAIEEEPIDGSGGDKNEDDASAL